LETGFGIFGLDNYAALCNTKTEDNLLETVQLDAHIHV